MIDPLLRDEVQDFIFHNETEDEKKLVLKHRTIFGIPAPILAEQISGRRKAKSKLPLYYNTKGIIYPPGLNLEQSSSEKTARFKASSLNAILPETDTLADLTGGFGIDSFFMSELFRQIHFIEPNASLHSIAQQNHQTLGAANIQYHNSTAGEFLKTHEETLDCIFIDPSRRSKGNQKVFKLSDCEPDVTTLLPDIFKISPCALIKTSPLLDIRQAIQELKHVEKVWVVSVDNECKELLFFCRREFIDEPEIIAINLQGEITIFSFRLSEEKQSSVKFSIPLTYIYEPNASILKAGAFKTVAEKFSVFKFHPNTHLYTSASLVENFPGRIFKKIDTLKAEPKCAQKFFTEGKANVITRNYPLSPKLLKKKTKLMDGGTLYLLGFSGQAEKYLIAARRLK